VEEGGIMMKMIRRVRYSSTLLFMACIVCVGLVGSAQAVPPVQPYPIEPFVDISVTPDKIDLGNVSPRGQLNLPAELTVHIVANCPHRVGASFEPFTREGGGGGIRPEHISVVINGIGVPVAGAPVLVVSSPKPTPIGGVDLTVELKFGVEDALLYPAGAYRATLAFTIMPGP